MSETPSKELDDDELEDIDRVLSDRFDPAAVDEVAFLGGDGPNTVVSIIAATGDRYVVKCAHDRAGAGALRLEAAVSRFVDEQTPVPTVVPLDASLDTSPPYLVWPWVDGRPLAAATRSLPSWRRPALFQAVGRALAEVHEHTAFDHPGDLVVRGDASVEVDPAENWPAFVRARLDDRCDVLRGTRFEATADAVAEAVSHRLANLDTGTTPVLLHGDIGDDNLRFHDGDLVAVLDWEMAFVGHPEYDLARAEARLFMNDWGRRTPNQAVLVRGYESVRPLENGYNQRRQNYLALAYLSLLERFPVWGPTIGDDLDELAATMADRVRRLVSDPT